MAKENNYQCRLINKYNDEVMKQLSSTLNITNVMRLPKMEKIVLNMGIGDARENAKALKSGVEELSAISGQKAVVTHAKKAISNFKTRAGDPVGVRVTLRRIKMYEFLDRFISVASPRIRDFQGLSAKGFDGRGNYNFGIEEQIIFPEVDYDKVNQIRGMNISIVTSAHTDDEACELLVSIGLPIRKKRTIEEDGSTEEVVEAKVESSVEEDAPVEEDGPTEEVAENKEENGKKNKKGS